MERKRVWLYSRVAHSGPDSTEILAMQQRIMEHHAKECGFEIVGFSSDINSGRTFDRPGLLDFHSEAEGGNVDVLLVLDLSRLGRDLDGISKYWHLLRDIGVSIHTVDCGKVDFSFCDTLYKMIIEMLKQSK